MAVFIKAAKRVSDPLDDRVKARLLSSDHCQLTGYAHPSSCFCGLDVHAFLELDEPPQSITPSSSNCREIIKSDCDEGGDGDLYAHAAEMVRGLLGPCARPDFHAAVMEAAETLKLSGSRYRRAVMARLRERGYNAGLCKARWQSSGGLTAGSYEYIDIVVHREERYIVDLDFAAQFQIARTSIEYEKMVASLPVVIIANAEEVKQVVRIMVEAAKKSLKSRELSVPPWRKRRYMLAKWFGPYSRTVNPLPPAGAAVAGKGEIKCRAVGFVAAASWGIVAPATRT